MLKPFTHKHSKRWLKLKLSITLGFFITMAVDSLIGSHLILAINLVWLWVDFEETTNA